MQVELTESFMEQQSFESTAQLVEEINTVWQETFDQLKNLTDDVDEAEAWDRKSLSRHDRIMRKLQKVTIERASLLEALVGKAQNSQQKVMARSAYQQIQDSQVSYEDFKNSMYQMLDEAVDRRRSTLEQSYPPTPRTPNLMASTESNVQFNMEVYDQERIISERQERIFEIEKKAGELKGLAGDVCVQIYATGKKVEGINENVDVAAEQMAETNKELAKAVQGQKKNSKCIWISIVVSIVIVLVIIGVILAYVFARDDRKHIYEEVLLLR
jgi:hypothetical protein